MSILIRKKEMCVIHKQYLANGINDVEIENLVFLFIDVFFAYIYLSTYIQIAKSILPTYRKSLKLQKSMKISLLVFSWL